MEQPQVQPLHTDTPRGKLPLTLILSGVVAVIGFITVVNGGNPFLLILGLIGAGFSWFTNAKQYLIYTNALVIVYGQPRVKAFSFSEISHLEMLVLPMGNRLRVRLVSGRRIMVAAQNVEEFRDRLDEAMEKFNSTYQPPQLQDESQENTTPY